MPRLWNETIEAHRREVHAAIMDTTCRMVSEQGLRAVTMSQIAERTGIGRATLYKYFPDVEAILLAWHQRQVAGHLQQLTSLRDRAGSAGERLRSVLEAYAFSRHHGRQGSELSALLHDGAHVAATQQQVVDLIADMLTDVAGTGELRDDVAPAELAVFCLHALAAASTLPSAAAVRRLVTVTMAALRPLP